MLRLVSVISFGSFWMLVYSYGYKLSPPHYTHSLRVLTECIFFFISHEHALIDINRCDLLSSLFLV